MARTPHSAFLNPGELGFGVTHLDSSSPAQLPIPNFALTKGGHFPPPCCPASPAPAEVSAYAESLSQEITAKSLLG